MTVLLIRMVNGINCMAPISETNPRTEGMGSVKETTQVFNCTTYLGKLKQPLHTLKNLPKKRAVEEGAFLVQTKREKHRLVPK